MSKMEDHIGGINRRMIKLCGLMVSICIILILFPGNSRADSSSTSINLTWTAPGDNGDEGTAYMYDIRYSTSNISESNWGSAIQVSSEPSPQPAGSQESFSIEELQPGTIYYIGIKTADEVFNWSELSNIACDTTLNEQIAPAEIVDLEAVNPTETSVTLIWTAPGDDGNQGTAAEYDIRYSTFPITEQSWDSATQVISEPSPQPAGIQDTFVVVNLQPEITYYFAIKTADDVPNWSGISNVVSVTTPDQISPAAINDLSALIDGKITEIYLTLTRPRNCNLLDIVNKSIIKIDSKIINKLS